MNDLKSPHNYIAKHLNAIPKSGIRKFFDLVNTMDGVVTLGIGEPDFITPWHIREQAVYGLEKGHTSYTSNAGKLSLRKAITQYVEKEFGGIYNPVSECIVTVGVSEALDLIFRAILDPGDEVIYHEPSYVSYPAEIAMAHGVPVSIPTYESEEFKVNPQRIREAITTKTKAILLNFPCNPTGAILDHHTLSEIAKIAIEYNLLVISDEIYSELTYTQRVPSIVSFPGMKEHSVFLHGFSKAFAMTGLRLGYACGPAPLIDAMIKIHQYSILCASTMAQEAAEEALKNGHHEMLKMREEYNIRRQFITKKLNEMGLTCRTTEGAFYVFPSIQSTGLNSETFSMRLLSEQKVAVIPGTAFGVSGEGYIRCSYSTSIEKINESMNRMKKFVESLKK